MHVGFLSFIILWRVISNLKYTQNDVLFIQNKMKYLSTINDNAD
ncbi:hypothetical protein HMPREF1565_1696 [Providencia alcalifaciens RIMD 1656011]|uniref:Uncharacterized protein n=2 Tax=Providencia alcalifaciens TaxID=126385 RepID=B6XEQ2_9GAMM|nr:hypothetical protein PROVALCAL_01832 [Providencia alcalifaciens DSM 30120]EUC94567.1 hypothetical protein HMPREF1567_1358 [Providencia alcalifaciens PAL-2]EUD02385.1 hypothetical protein HMPREF1565_1696 [Providencia alcalifaciens RIMD 1656011]EUD08072.1 hypothetical protein HMPREF1564_1048 [Providencia alcalifaciens R90-1475]EUD09408.1 hypothetical protein HMPREF1563_4160 [Providencia alcalifaciens 205/92]